MEPPKWLFFFFLCPEVPLSLFSSKMREDAPFSLQIHTIANVRMEKGKKGQKMRRGEMAHQPPLKKRTMMKGCL